MQNTHKFIRRTKTIINVETGKKETFASINKAKKASAKLTKAYGLGSVIKY